MRCRQGQSTDQLRRDRVAGGAVDIDGGGGPALLQRCTFSGNRGAYGGSIRSNGGTLTVTDSTFRDNHAGATAAGGGEERRAAWESYAWVAIIALAVAAALVWWLALR